MTFRTQLHQGEVPTPRRDRGFFLTDLASFDTPHPDTRHSFFLSDISLILALPYSSHLLAPTCYPSNKPREPWHASTSIEILDRCGITLFFSKEKESVWHADKKKRMDLSESIQVSCLVWFSMLWLIMLLRL